jgi:hypothetical protein
MPVGIGDRWPERRDHYRATRRLVENAVPSSTSACRSASCERRFRAEHCYWLAP